MPSERGLGKPLYATRIGQCALSRLRQRPEFALSYALSLTPEGANLQVGTALKTQDWNEKMSLSSVQAEIAEAERAASRTPGSARLMAVSKVQPLARIETALDAGHRLFGENRVQEAAGKWPALKERFPDVELHLIGPLQTNKTRQAMALFDAIQSVDRPKLARKIADVAGELGACPQLLIQVNTGDEPQKAGVATGELDEFVNYCRDELKLPIRGLMCIPPVDEEPALHFALLAKLAKRNDLPELSMGMSGDYASAIAFGATYVRVGSAIFGARDPAKV